MAAGMTAFNPDNSWRRVPDAAQPSLPPEQSEASTSAGIAE
jgi:hypothetical protein